MDDAQRAKRAAYMRRWTAAHPEYKERKRIYQKTYYAANRAAISARNMAWYWEHRDEAIAAASRWQRLHRIPKGQPLGERHHGWKGAHASYFAIHIWIASRKGRPSKCEVCGTTTAKRFEWCNVDHEYGRNVDDYFRACTSCHRRYDYENELSFRGSRWTRAIPS